MLYQSKQQNAFYDAYPDSKIFLIDYQKQKLNLATSEAAIIFKNSFINLVKASPRYKNEVIPVVGPIFYRIIKISLGRPIIRNNGKKIYNGFILQAMENLNQPLENINDNTHVITTYIYDIDSNSLFWYSTPADRATFQVSPSTIYLSRCSRYCHFNN